MAKKAAKKTASKGTKRKGAAKRELIDAGSDKRYVRRGSGGKFKESDEVGKSLSRDVPSDSTPTGIVSCRIFRAA